MASGVKQGSTLGAAMKRLIDYHIMRKVSFVVLEILDAKFCVLGLEGPALGVDCAGLGLDLYKLQQAVIIYHSI